MLSILNFQILLLFTFFLFSNVLASESEEEEKETMTLSTTMTPRITTQSHPLRLIGVLEANHLDMLKGDYTEISLHSVGGYDNELAFYEHYLIVSPDTINQNVRILFLRRCGLKDIHIEKINLFTHLEELCLSANMITDEGVKFITQLDKHNLKILYLALTRIGNEGTKLLAGMSRLIELDISVNSSITDEGAQWFLTNTTLQKLDIKSTSISRKMHKSLKRDGLDIEYHPCRGQG